MVSQTSRPLMIIYLLVNGIRRKRTRWVGSVPRVEENGRSKRAWIVGSGVVEARTKTTPAGADVVYYMALSDITRGSTQTP